VVVTPAPPVVTAPPAVGPPEPAPSHTGTVVGFAMIGAGVVADGIAVLEGLRAKQKADQLTQDSMKSGMVTFDPGVESAGKTANIAAIVLGIGGTALAITGAIILISGGGSSTSLGETPTTTAQVTFTPWLGNGLVGGGARLAF
jgi:hypothetical protein